MEKNYQISIITNIVLHCNYILKKVNFQVEAAASKIFYVVNDIMTLYLI